MRRLRCPGLGAWKRLATTSGGGAYVFAGLATGDYTVQATAPQLAVLAQAQALTIPSRHSKP